MRERFAAAMRTFNSSGKRIVVVDITLQFRDLRSSTPR
jgi:hypothetical protein